MPYNHPLFLMGCGALCVFALFLPVCWLAARWRNAGIVDVFWPLGFMLLAGLYLLLGHGWPQRQALVAGCLAVAHGRLAWHLGLRFLKHFPAEDSRYAALRSQWLASGLKPQVIKRRFTLIILGQGLLLTALTHPVAVAVTDVQPAFTGTEPLGAVLWAIGSGMACVADWQLSRFKQKQPEKTAICQQGLWRLSRHPNYFGEWLSWVGYTVMAFGSPGGVYTLWVPILMYILLRYGSGVAATEAQALKHKGLAYTQYQAHTPVFFPKFHV